MKFKYLIGLLFFANAAFAGDFAEDSEDFICSYTARISDDDKLNSSGNSVVSGVNKASVAAILRQDRANLHEFGLGDYEDNDGSCDFSNSAARQQLAKDVIANADLTKAQIRRIVRGNPLIKVEILHDYMIITIL